MASNHDGVWNRAGASLDFSIQPTYYETRWFQAACVASFLAAIWVLYRYRLSQIAHEYNVRVEERVGERTRIARDLHDTLLQSFQGSLFEFQAARNLFARRPEDAMHSLDEAICSADAAIAEGRDAIQDLRSGSRGRGDLLHLLTATARELSDAQASNSNGARFRVTVEGTPQVLSPALQDEVYRIGREIVRNAFRHARAKQIEVEIRYDYWMLRLRIRDDGIGIDPQVLREGARRGHWGLPGVRERAKIISARLDFWSEVGAGTEVQITIPASVAYLKRPDIRILRLFRKMTAPHDH
jgi:signal transduction histidine kinase